MKEWKMPHQTRSHPGMPKDKDLCKEEINSLLAMGLIRHSKSQWASTAFYVNKHSEQVRRMKRLVIDYKKSMIVYKT